MTQNPHHQVNAYGVQQQAQTQLDGREIDKRALLNCASRLKAALDKGPSDMVFYAEAIRHNQKLWTMFQVAITDPESQLPRDLKYNLLSLSRYIDRTSFRAVTEFLPTLVTSMIEINRILAAGLAKKVQQDPAQQANAMPAGTMAPASAVSVMIST